MHEDCTPVHVEQVHALPILKRVELFAYGNAVRYAAPAWDVLPFLISDLCSPPEWLSKAISILSMDDEGIYILCYAAVCCCTGIIN